jgi:hypothetical protein
VTYLMESSGFIGITLYSVVNFSICDVWGLCLKKRKKEKKNAANIVDNTEGSKEDQICKTPLSFFEEIFWLLVAICYLYGYPGFISKENKKRSRVGNTLYNAERNKYRMAKHGSRVVVYKGSRARRLDSSPGDLLKIRAAARDFFLYSWAYSTLQKVPRRARWYRYSVVNEPRKRGWEVDLGCNFEPASCQRKHRKPSNYKSTAFQKKKKNNNKTNINVNKKIEFNKLFWSLGIKKDPFLLRWVRCCTFRAL